MGSSVNVKILRLILAVTAWGAGAVLAQKPVPPSAGPRLPLATVFQGESKFQAMTAKAERENWRSLPLGERTVRVARELVGTPYINYSLEVDDKIESPVANLEAMDCWTYYENALAFARMLRYQPGPYKPQDQLHMVEIERYRNGVCTGSYLSRMHHLEEVFHDNQRRGWVLRLELDKQGVRAFHTRVAQIRMDGVPERDDRAASPCWQRGDAAVGQCVAGRRP